MLYRKVDGDVAVAKTKQDSDRMRSSKGMYAIAKAVALKQGLRSVWGNSNVIGFGLTYKDLERIYAREGYAIRKSGDNKIIDNHIHNWMLAQQIRKFGDCIFFYLDTEDLEDMQTYSYIVQYRREHPDTKAEIIGFRMEDIDGMGEAAR